MEFPFAYREGQKNLVTSVYRTILRKKKLFIQAQFPEWVTTIFGKSPVVLATIVAIVLNLTLPRTQKKAEK